MSKKHITECSSVETKLSDFIDKQLSAEEMEEIKSHIDTCSSCNVKYRNLITMKDMILSSYMPKSNIDLSKKIMAKVYDSETYKKKEHVGNTNIVKISKNNDSINMSLRKRVLNKVMFTLTIAATIVISIGGTIMYLENNNNIEKVTNVSEINLNSEVALTSNINSSDINKNHEIITNVNHVQNNNENMEYYDRYVLEHYATSYDNGGINNQSNLRSVNFEK